MADQERDSGESGPIKPPRKIYPWSISATRGKGYGFPPEQLLMLRAYDLDYVADMFNTHSYAIYPALLELILHGNDRRAADLARRLVSLNPSHRNRFGEWMDEETLTFWLETPLDEIPAGPSEIKTPVEYVQ